MNTEDYAIVVGVSKYPGLGEEQDPSSADLKASHRDAEAVAAWLVDPNGGGLPENNVKKFLTDDSLEQNANNASPKAEEIRIAFRSFIDLANRNRNRGEGLKVGRRLYIYMSGHGFSPRMGQGALYTANAIPLDASHSYASGWIEWFADNHYFEEYVLWMDCCMDRNLSTLLEPVFGRSASSGGAGKHFLAFAACSSEKTVERPIAEANGEIHGVFTWALLSGLRGAASDSSGTVRSESLRNYLLDEMRRYLTPEDLNNTLISKQPDVITLKDILFVTNPEPGLNKVDIKPPPGYNGGPVILWGGNPLESNNIATGDSSISTDLSTGLYFVEIPELGVRHGFEINSPQTIKIPPRTPGYGPPPKVEPPASVVERIPVHLNVKNAATEIFVINNKLKEICLERGGLHGRFDFGIYKLKARAGRDVQETIIILDRPLEFTLEDNSFLQQVPGLELRAPRIETALPINNQFLSHEYHADAAKAFHAIGLYRSPLLFGSAMWPPSTAEIRIMARIWNSKSNAINKNLDWNKVQLCREDGLVVSDLSEFQPETPQGIGDDPFLRARIEVIPGTYFLRKQRSDGRVFEQSLIASPGWAVEAYLVTVPTETGDESGSSFERVAVAMRALDSNIRYYDNAHSESSDLDTTIEAARIALADERTILNANLEALLFGKFMNPIAGIVGAHLLIIEADKQNNPFRLSLLDEVVPNLRILLGGHHPDVEAISLRCPRTELRANAPFRDIPMFDKSWRLMVEASQGNPMLVPAGLWGRMQAATSSGGLLLWAGDQASRNAHMVQIERWKTESEQYAAEFAHRGGLAGGASEEIGSSGPQTAFSRDAAARIGIPAAAFDALARNEFPMTDERTAKIEQLIAETERTLAAAEAKLQQKEDKPELATDETRYFSK